MTLLKRFFLLLLMVFFNACGGTTEKKIEENRMSTISVNAGNDKIVQVNTTIVIEGKGFSSDGSDVIYLWKKGEETLATSSSFEYTPTIIGTDILTLTIQHNSGATVSDSLKINVVEEKKTFQAPTISKERIREYLKLINAARIQGYNCGDEGYFPPTTPVSWSEKLYHAAYEHNYDMAYSGVFSHMGSGTKTDLTGYLLGKRSLSEERAENYGYNWSYVGENIGAGTVIDSPEKMVEGWLESPHHCVNIMNSNYKEVGMSLLKKSNAKYTHYWTQDFGTEK